MSWAPQERRRKCSVVFTCSECGTQSPDFQTVAEADAWLQAHMEPVSYAIESDDGRTIERVAGLAKTIGGL